MWIVYLASGVIILFLGFVTRKYNLSILVAGYNTAPAEEKQKYDERKMTRYVGNMLMMASAILLVSAIVFYWFDLPESAFFVSWAIFIIFLLGGLVFLNTNDRLKIKQ
jgi:O-antigen/teichoic acid export membrane protein